MKKYLSIFIIGSLFFVALIFIGCQSEQINNDTQANLLDSFEIDSYTVNNKLSNQEEIIIIDVRTPEEYNSGHLNEANLFPLDKLNEENLNIYDKNSEIIVYCRSGKRSAQAYKILNSLGFKNVKSMAGGIINWIESGYKMCSGEKITC